MAELDSRLKARLVDKVLDTDILVEECELFSLEGSDGVRRYQGVAELKADSDLAVAFSIPTETRNIYVTLTDGDRTLVRKVLATLEDIERETPVRLGNVQLLDSPELKDSKICGVIFLPVSTSNALKHLPSALSVYGVEYHFMLVVFINDVEHEVWKAHGHDALMDFFTAHNKDLVSFEQA